MFISFRGSLVRPVQASLQTSGCGGKVDKIVFFPDLGNIEVGLIVARLSITSELSYA